MLSYDSANVTSDGHNSSKLIIVIYIFICLYIFEVVGEDAGIWKNY